MGKMRITFLAIDKNEQYYPVGGMRAKSRREIKKRLQTLAIEPVAIEYKLDGAIRRESLPRIKHATVQNAWNMVSSRKIYGRPCYKKSK